MKKLLFCIAIVFSGASFAQQTSLSNIYNDNRILLNPANTGDQGHLAGFINHRNQWVGNAGSPNAQFVGLHSPLTERVSLGGVIQNFQQGLMRQTSLQLNYGYLLPINDEHKVKFALGASLFQHGINLSDAVVEDPSEYGLMNGDLNGFAFNSSFGVVYNWRTLEVGFSLPNFLPFGTARIHPDNDPFNQFETQLLAHASYQYEFDNNLAIQPLVVARIVPNRSYVFDNWVFLDYKNLMWLGLGYRTQTEGSFMATAGTWLTKNINFNYSYEYSNSPYGALSLGTHELSLGFQFGDEEAQNPFTALKREKSPKRYTKKKREKKDKKKKKITIITEGYETDEESPDIEFKVSPNEGKVNQTKSDNESKLEKEVREIRERLDILLLDDSMSKSSLNDELNKIRIDLNNLLEKNKEGKTEEVSEELEVIGKQLQELRKKIESK